MWSLGCILGQLINATPQYKGFKQAKDFQHCLFDGDSCYPISPYVDEQEENEDVNQFSFKDQLGEIMKQIGPLSETDKSFIDDKNKLDYVDMFQDLIDNGEDGKSTYVPLRKYFS